MPISSGRNSSDANWLINHCTAAASLGKESETPRKGLCVRSNGERVDRIFGARGRPFGCVDTYGEMSERKKHSGGFSHKIHFHICRRFCVTCHVRTGRFCAHAALPRACQFELLAEAEDSPDVRLRYRIVASHYRELVEREEKADKAMMAELIERARLQRQPAASKASLPATSNSHSFPIGPSEP
jgi:hypothetical protein